MNSANNSQLVWLHNFPELQELEQDAIELLLKNSRIMEAPVGTIGYREGEPCNAYVLRLAGKSRVYKNSPGGREILLYRVSAGETCVITTTCLLGNSDYPASTIVEDAIKDVLIPAKAFNQLMNESNVFRKFVMNNYGALISNLIALLVEVAFKDIHSRLIRVLMDSRSSHITRTHQEIADELGTSREVVSRQLKRLEMEGLIKLGRGSIHIVNLE